MPQLLRRVQAVRLDRSSNVPNIARGHSATNQEIRESALPAYDTYWQPSDMALRGEYLQEQRLASSTSSAPSRVSAASTPSSTIMEHTPMSLDTHAAGQSATPARSHSMPSSQEGPVQLQYPYPSTAIQSTSHQGVNQPSSALHAIDEGFVKMSFPLQTADHLLKREALRSVMLSPWKLNGQFEPNASLLLQFMRLDAAEGRWYCSFWKDGKICGCSCKKKDHAKGHIRSHLDLLPYVCSDNWCVCELSWIMKSRWPLIPKCLNCPTSGSGCGRRYPAIEPLQKHRKGKATCEDWYVE